MPQLAEAANVIVEPYRYCSGPSGRETGLQRAEAAICLDQPYACFQLRGGVSAAPCPAAFAEYRLQTRSPPG